MPTFLPGKELRCPQEQATPLRAKAFAGMGGHPKTHQSPGGEVVLGAWLALLAWELRNSGRKFRFPPSSCPQSRQAAKGQERGFLSISRQARSISEDATLSGLWLFRETSTAQEEGDQAPWHSLPGQPPKAAQDSQGGRGPSLSSTRVKCPGRHSGRPLTS